MAKEYLIKAEMLHDLAKFSDIDVEETAKCADYGFVTKSGEHHWTPMFHSWVDLLIEKANARLVKEECHQLPFSYIMSFKEVADKVVEESVAEVVTENETEESVKEETKTTKRGSKKS